MKFKIYKFKSVTSTNDVAINLIREEKKRHGCVYADLQTKGRGTRGKKWVSNKGNLFSSLFFPLKKKYPTFDEFSIINPVIISDVIKRFCGEKNISLKFPNDLFLNKKKVGGILQEVVTFNNREFLIIGIGLNILSNPKINNNYKATNIFLETKKILKIKKLIDLIILSYEKFFMRINFYDFKNFKKKAEMMSIN